MIPALTAPSIPLAPAAEGQRDQLKEASQQFEAIFVRQFLAAARKTSFDDGLFDSQALGTFRQMQDERFAEVAAQRGTLGLAAIIEAQLARHLPQSPPADPPQAQEKQ